MSLKSRTGLIAAVSLLAFAGQASAETLADAIALAYASNPTLQSQRAQLRALDENYVQARAGFRPTADVSASAQYQFQEDGGGRSGFLGNGGFSDAELNSGSGTLSVSQPLYTGGRTTNAIRAVEADILSAREQLRQIEQQVMLNTVQSYADVVRDVESLRIREENVGVLRRQLEESQARFEVGEITRTDVAQSEARLAASQALLAQAQAQLAISRSSYAAVVGQNPGDLEPAPPLPGVPATVDEAFTIGQEENPGLRSAEFSEQASRSRVAAAKAETRPSVSLRGTLGYSGALDPFDRSDFDRQVTASAVVQQPLFAGGVIRSRIRQALEQNNADLIDIDGARRDVLQGVSQAWNQLLASRASIVANQEQVRAARIAAEGVREEAAVGLRTTIEVLNAELELRNAQLAVAQTRRDDYVASASLLGAMGRLQARSLLPGTTLYDADANFQRVKGFGGVPWEGVVSSVDKLGAPAPQERPDTGQATAGEVIATRR